MTGFVRKATLISVSGLLAAATAMASVPSPATSLCPGCVAGGGAPFIRFVGHRGASPSLAHQATATGGNPIFTMTIKDFAGNPVAGSVVELNTTNCTDLLLCEVPFSDPGLAPQTIDCPNHIVRATTNALGQVTMAGPGAALHTAASTGGAGLGCVQIVADGIPLATATAVDYDQNGGSGVPTPVGANGIDALDVSLTIQDIGLQGAGQYRGRADYSPTLPGVINAADLSVMIQYVGETAAGTGSASGCSTGAGPTEAAGINYCP